MKMLEYESKYWNNNINLVAGIDEAGRGPLAGPVVASCVILKPFTEILGVNDSKKLTENKRNELFEIIKKKALDVSVGIAHEDEIDNLNILQATFLAMKRAIGNLKYKPEQLLIDGPYSNIKLFKVENIINGDNKSLSIAAASIIAKVTRDQIMKEYDLIFPDYKFSNNKGYGTKIHIQALKDYKATPIHRKSFKIVKSYLPTYSFIKENDKFKTLGRQIIATNFIKKNYIQFSSKRFANHKNKYFDYVYSNLNEIIFIKALVSFEEYETPKINDIEVYIDFIKNKILEKESKKTITFNVISIEFKYKKKTKINKIYSEKIY